MTTKFNLTRDINGYNGFGLVPAEDIFSANLATGVASSITVPANFTNWIAIFSYEVGANVWVCYNGTATFPSSGTFSAGTSELDPAAWQVRAGDTISCVTPDASARVMVKLYALQ